MRRIAAKHSPFEAACFVDSVELVASGNGVGVFTLDFGLRDANNEPVVAVSSLRGWFSSDAAGTVLHATTPSIIVATKGSVAPGANNKTFTAITDANGEFAMSGAQAVDSYIHLQLPNGRIVSSGLLNLA